MNERRGRQMSSEERREEIRSARDIGPGVATRDRGQEILPDGKPLKSFVSVLGHIDGNTFSGLEPEDRIGEIKKIIHNLIHR